MRMCQVLCSTICTSRKTSSSSDYPTICKLSMNDTGLTVMVCTWTSVKISANYVAYSDHLCWELFKSKLAYSDCLHWKKMEIVLEIWQRCPPRSAASGLNMEPVSSTLWGTWQNSFRNSKIYPLVTSLISSLLCEI